MALIEGQWQVRDLVLGPGTPYRVLVGTNPFARNVRADTSGTRAWNHGSWSGAEWMQESVVTFTLLVRGDNTQEWLANQQELQAAFRPIGDLVEDVELRWAMGGREYLMFGRPRMVEPELHTTQGDVITKAAFVALDPLIYSGAETEHVLGLPTFSGGLEVAFTIPFTVDAVQDGGIAAIVNDGKAPTGLTLRIDGPVVSPSVTLIRPGLAFQKLRFDFTIADGQWLDVDTAARTALLNGVSSRRGQVTGDWPILPPGPSTLRWSSQQYNDDAQLTATYRSAWW